MEGRCVLQYSMVYDGGDLTHRGVLQDAVSVEGRGGRVLQYDVLWGTWPTSASCETVGRGGTCLAV